MFSYVLQTQSQEKLTCLDLLLEKIHSIGESPVKRTCEANAAGENSFLQSVPDQFHVIILSLPM